MPRKSDCSCMSLFGSTGVCEMDSSEAAELTVKSDARFSHGSKLEDSELLEQADDADLSEFDFPSPSFSRRKNLPLRIFLSSSTLSRDFENDEPLFWPYDQKLYNFFELDENFLCLSPRKDLRKVENKRVNGINNLSEGRNRMQEVCGRRIESSSTQKKNDAEFRAAGSCNNSIKSCSRTPSRLSRFSAQCPIMQLPCNSCTDKASSSTKKETLQLKLLKQMELPKKSLLEFEANGFHEFWVEGFSIEKLVGLDEFDGRHGLNVELSSNFGF